MDAWFYLILYLPIGFSLGLAVGSMIWRQALIDAYNKQCQTMDEVAP